jgi:hypothetical protein
MNEMIYICPWNKELISRLNGRRLIINTNGFTELTEISETVNRDNELVCIRIHFNACLTDLMWREEWETLPLVLYCKGIGDYKQFLAGNQRFKKMNIQIFFPSTYSYHYAELKILSSLRIHCGIVLDHQPVNWDLLNDLMHYSLYTQIIHGHIDPFHYVAKNYRVDTPTDYYGVYYVDPSIYIHLDEEGNAAFSPGKLKQGEYLEQPFLKAEQLQATKAYKEMVYDWHKHFIEFTPCSCCPAWRICLGKYARLDNHDECRAFFTDLLEAAEYHRKIKQEYES